MKIRNVLLIILDLLIVFVSYIFATIVRFDFQPKGVVYLREIMIFIPVFILIHFSWYKILKTDKSIWSRISIDEAVRVAIANFLSMVTIVLLRSFQLFNGLSLGIALIAFTFITLTQEIVRFSYRLYRIESLKKDRKNGRANRVVIYGAGSAGYMIAKEILENEDYDDYIVGFIDDNLDLKGKTIMGLSIFGSRKELPRLIQDQTVDDIIVAMPSTSAQKRKQIIQHCLNLNVNVKTVASAQKLLQGNDFKNAIRKIEITDLLERPEMVINDDEIQSIITGRSILVTGAGGSIGSELVRQIVKYDPEKLILLDISETGLYNIEQELRMRMRSSDLPNLDIEAKIASIRDYDTLEEIFQEGQFDLIFHAAAHKHVPLMESAPKEAIKNNIFGTKNLIELADKYEVSQFVNISTDKAVNPTNVMGATKRFNEMMLQCKNSVSKTNFVAVRFGNVLGSNGSVVPLFQKQIQTGGPLTVTHPDIIRYFMTIPEAVSLVLQAATYAKGGEIFVLDMGEPVKILHLAENVIKLSGYEPYVDIDITFTGLRPGEKLYEELLMAEEGLQKTENDLIFIANPINYSVADIDDSVEYLLDLLEKPDTYILENLHKVVDTYKHKEEI